MAAQHHYHYIALLSRQGQPEILPRCRSPRVWFCHTTHHQDVFPHPSLTAEIYNVIGAVCCGTTVTSLNWLRSGRYRNMKIGALVVNYVARDGCLRLLSRLIAFIYTYADASNVSIYTLCHWGHRRCFVCDF